MEQMQQAWYKNAIFYSLDVETFCDSNGDGIGDFRGLISRMEYIAGLGASCIWLLPFYPSPNRDNGYDVMDYYNVDSRLGDLGDFALFLNKAEELGIRVIIDLVVNHTSIQHSWFQEARKNKASPYREFYVWADEPKEFEEDFLMLKGEESSIWTYDEVAGQYYLHRFYKEQPDLNISNPRVKEEILKIMAFWLRLGVNGFRIDAAEMLIDPYGLQETAREDLNSFLNTLREFVQSMKGDALLLAEVNAGPEAMKTYLEGGTRMHMLFNFFLNQHLFLSLATESKAALEEALHSLPEVHHQVQWLNFLRHHDELSLRLLPEEDSRKVLRRFAPEENMRIFGTGIRRRLAPMMNNDQERLKMAYSLLFSMPGAQLIRYGDEIGMGDNLALEGRTSVRTPMQWSPLTNGGFSSAPKEALVHPVVDYGEFGYQHVNLMNAQQQANSFLNWLEQLLATRRQCPEIGNGEVFTLPYANKAVLIHGYTWKGKKLLCLHNFSGADCTILKEDLVQGEKLFSVFGKEVAEEWDSINLNAYGFQWLRAVK